MKEVKPINIDLVTRPSNDVINGNLPFTSILSVPQAEDYAIGHFVGRNDRRAGMDRHKVFDTVAKPPRSFSRKMVLHKARPQCCGKVMNHSG